MSDTKLFQLKNGQATEYSSGKPRSSGKGA